MELTFSIIREILHCAQIQFVCKLNYDDSAVEMVAAYNYIVLVNQIVPRSNWKIMCFVF
jgi:hypothetical protein